MVNKILYNMSLAILIALVSYDIALLYIYSTDIPFWDTWDLMPKGGFSHIFEFYNENMQLFYFIISEIVYKFFDWNLRYFNFINFAIYLLLAFVYLIILSKANSNKNCFYPIFLCALFTPMLGFNWLWVFLVQTHTFILFFLLAIYWGYTKDDKSYSVYLYGICLFFSIVSMNIPLAIGGYIAYIIKEIINIKKNNIAINIKKCVILSVLFLLFYFVLTVITTPDRFIRVNLSNNIFTYLYIKHLSFYIVNCLSLFSLADIISEKVCIFWFVLHFILLAIVFFEQYKDKEKQSLWGILFSTLFCVCGVVSFRGGEVYSYGLSYIRHNETAFMMIPATLMVLFLSKYKIIKLYGYILLCLMLYGVVFDIKSEKFKFFGELFYKNGCVCLNHYWNLKTIDTWECKMNFPIAHGTGIEIGKKMKLGFIETMKNCN